MTPGLVHLHGLFVVLSLAGFITRGLWMLRDSPRLKARWVRIAPQVVDTLLLCTALLAAWRLYWQHGAHPAFLSVKIAGLLLYIALGLIALRLGRTKAVRATAFTLAVLLFLYLMAVAITRQPFPFIR
ncbi:MAG: SirB2 family protein [Pseudomonadota bacterium]|jgi:uncharacterized membrane protein SirB2